MKNLPEWKHPKLGKQLPVDILLKEFELLRPANASKLKDLPKYEKNETSHCRTTSAPNS
jgi:hypothetical protein